MKRGQTDTTDGVSARGGAAPDGLHTVLFRYESLARRFQRSAMAGALAAGWVRSVQGHTFKLGDERGLIGLVGARARPHYVPNVQSEPRWLGEMHAVRSAYFAPIVSDAGGPLGVLVFLSAQVDAFGPEHRALADQRARDIATHLQLADRLDALGSTAEADALRSAIEGEAPARSHEATHGDLSALSSRELEVVSALRRGLRLSDIARTLGISVHTARNHLKHVYTKLGVHSQVELLSVLDNRTQSATDATRASGPQPLRLLYVEDNTTDADLMRRELAGSAPHVVLTHVPSVAQAQETLRRDDVRFDAVLVDLHLADGSGLDLVQAVRALSRPTPVIVLTGSNAPELPFAVLKAGADDYWLKEGDFLGRAAQRLESCLRRFRAEASLAAQPLRVIYAESNLADANLTERHMETHAPQIRLDTVHGFEALQERLARAGVGQSYDVILVEHRTGPHCTLDLIKALREDRHIETPVVVVARAPDGPLAAQVLRFGATDFVVKTPGYLFALPAVLRGAHHRAQLALEQAAAKERELMLREANARFVALFEKVGVGVAQLDSTHGRFVRANPRFCEVLGYDATEILEQDLFSVSHAEGRDGIRNSLIALRAGDLREFALETRWQRKDGQTVCVSLRVSPMWSASHSAQDCIAVVEDISERVWTRNAQQLMTTRLAPLTGEAYFAAIAMEVAKLLGVEVGFVGKWVDGTTPRIRMVGFSADGCSIDNAEYETARTPFEHVLQHDVGVFPSNVLGSFPGARTLGTLGVTGFAGVALTSVGNRNVGVIGVMSRAPLANTERIEGLLRMFAVRTSAELERQRGDAQLQDLFEYLPQAVLIVDEHGTITLCNRRAETLLGYPRQQLQGMSVDVLVPAQQRGRHDGLRRRFVADARPRPMVGNTRLTAERSDGTLVPVEIFLNPMRSDDRTLIVTTIHDLSATVSMEREQERLADQLRQAQKLDAVGTLASGIAHDFNNLLGVVAMSSESARLQLPDDHGARHDLDDVRVAVDRASALVRRILTFSRESPTDLKPMAIGNVLEETTKLLRATLPARVELAITRTTDAIMLGDATQIHQVLVNLCTNAWHALDGNAGRIELRIEEVSLNAPTSVGRAVVAPGRYVHISVHDTGKGMDLHTQERMFEPFFTTKPKGQGTGLGLSVVHGIVKSHDGVIAAESALGEGTVFHLYFPALSGTPAEEVTPESTQTSPSIPLNILVVDDEVALAQSTARVLAKHGHRPTQVASALAALDVLSSNPHAFDLIIADYNMPKMSGLELAETLQARSMHIPVVLMSGNVNNELRQRAASAGVRSILPKPFTSAHLRAAIEQPNLTDARA